MEAENRYFIDTTSGAEMARLNDQDRLLTKALGGFFPVFAPAEIGKIQRILDIGCGPGGWTQGVAFNYPDKETVGIDYDHEMIQYAQASAKIQKLENSTFYVMDATQPLPLADNSFDLITGRLIVSFLNPSTAKNILKECYRILRPGGHLHFCEVEIPLTNSLALETIWRWLYRALYRIGQSFSPSGELLGIVPMLASILQQGGFQEIRQVPHLIDHSAGTEFYAGFQQDFIIACKLYEPFVINAGITTAEEFDRTYNQMQLDMLKEDFRSLLLFLSAIGTKPEHIS